MRTFLHFLALSCLLAALSGCGTKGPLYLPKKPPDAKESTR